MSKPQLTIEVFREGSWAPMPGSQFILLRKPPGYYWRIRHRNGRIMADSGEGYKRRRDCLKAIATLKAGFAKAEVKEME